MYDKRKRDAGTINPSIASRLYYTKKKNYSFFTPRARIITREYSYTGTHTYSKFFRPLFAKNSIHLLHSVIIQSRGFKIYFYNFFIFFYFYLNK